MDRRLAEQEALIDAILDVAGSLVVVVDARGRLVRFNRACERLTGFAAADVVGKQLWDVVVPAWEADDVRRMLAELPASAYPNVHENHWITRDGAERLISWRNACLTDERGAVTAVVATGIDVTDARRGQDGLRGIETVGRLLAQTGPVEATLDAVLDELQSRLGYRFLSLYLQDPAGLRLGAQRGYDALPVRLDATSGVTGRVYRTGRFAFVPDVASDPDYLRGHPQVVAEIAVPLLGERDILGVLNIESDAPSLSDNDLRIATAVADRLATAMLLSRGQAALRERVRLFAALTQFASVANAILDSDRLARALIAAVGAVVPSDTAVITTLDRADGEYRVRAVRGIASDVIGAVIRPGDGNTGRAIVDRRVISEQGHGRAGYAAPLREKVLYDSMWGVAVPMIREGRVLGVISVGRAGDRATFSDSEREVLELLGYQAALALANAFLVEDVSALAIHDGLTGLYNRRHFDAALDLAIARWKRREPDGTLAAIMFDLDRFGAFNRLHGHLAGDAVLREFAGILRERLRSSDLVARYGGEEFVVVLEDCGLREAMRLADAVRAALEGRDVAGAGDSRLHATVSAGCSVIDRGNPTRDTLLGRADAALFAAKRAGRNRVIGA